MIITTLNPSTDALEKSYLANPYSVGVTSIQVRNADRFATNYRIMIGEMGLEATEIVTVSAVAADNQTLTIGATLYPHSADDPVYVLRFDQVKIYCSTTGINGTYSLLAGTPVPLDVDNADLATVYDDTTGLSTYYYKTSVYHSISTLESSQTDAIGGGGYRRNQVGYIIDEILREVNDPNEQHVTRIELLGYFNDVNDDLTTNVARPYDFLRARTTLTRTAGVNYINFPTDTNGDQTMWKFDRMDYNFTDSSSTTNITYTLRVIPEEDFRNKYSDNTLDATTENDRTQEMCLDTAVNRFRFAPPFATTAAGAFYLYYWAYLSRISTEGQEVQTPTSKIYKLYAKYCYYDKRAGAEPSYKNQSQSYQNLYLREISNYTKLNRKDQGTPRGFRPASKNFQDYRR